MLFKIIEYIQANKYARVLPVLIPFLFLVILGSSSIDFGYHWDENNHTVGVAKEYVLKGQLIPSQYIYPSMSSYLVLSGTTPYVIPLILDKGFDWPAISGFLINSVFNNNPSFNLNVRKIFLVISATSLLWAYLYKLENRRHWLEAILAASLVGVSWEVAYHVRWIASDGLIMQWGILVVLLSTLAIRHPQNRRFWLPAAAIAAGFATSTKYTAGLLFIPLVIATYYSFEWNMKSLVRKYIPEQAGLLFIFGLSYLVITPGTVLDPITFFRDLGIGARVYGSGHGQQTVQAGVDHFWRLGIYLSQVVFSHYRLVGLFFSIPAIVGIYSKYRQSKKETILFLSFPVVYVLFFGSRSVMFVRNYLVLIPFLAILSARGIVYIYDWLKSKAFKMVWVTLVTALLLVNAGWLLYSAGTIQDRGTDRFINEFQAYVVAHPETTFLVSDQVWDNLAAVSDRSAVNLRRELSSDVDLVAVYFYESTVRPGYWPVNFPGLAPEWFGPLEINMDYYASWQGDDRILLMPLDKAEEINILLLQGD